MEENIKVCLSITPDQTSRSNGIGQVVLAQWKYLPEFGVTPVSDPNGAHVLACHIQKPSHWPRVDLACIHGLYWDDVEHLGFSKWHNEANAGIIEVARQAIAVTVPSNWVGEPFRRDMRIKPVVIPHGVDLSEFKPAKPHGYVLYNKNRESDVCQSRPAWELAQAGVPVVSTFSPGGLPIPDIMKVTGLLPFEDMKPMVAQADMYLATTIETFGIGTVEALASGVPVLGYNWGGTADIVKHKVTGYLVEPGDINGLLEGWLYIRAHRDEMAQAALEDVKRFDWRLVIQKYAALCRAIASFRPKNDAAVIITNYNYGKWVGEAITSVVQQTVKPAELVVVDDGSTDNSKEIINSYKSIVSEAGITFKTIFQPNGGVASARNNGIAASEADFITCLDADDRLAPQFIEGLRPALEKDRGLGIAYSGLALIGKDGKISSVSAWPPEFDWEIMAEPHNPPGNCIPSGCMFRRAMWNRAGGYRQEYAPGEDTEFWVRGLSVGFRAKKIVRDPLFEYRGHEGSASRTLKYRAIDDNLPWMRSKDYPIGAPAKKYPSVKANVQPAVSIIIPMGPGHEYTVTQTIDSILAQTFYSWEIVLVNDTQKPFKLPPAYPFVRVIDNPGPKHGAGVARNMGVKAAKSPLVLFLDADDLLSSVALEHMLNAFSTSNGRYIYSDWLAVNKGAVTTGLSKDFTRDEWRMFHPVTVLIPRKAVLDLGGFDEDLESWEDWEFFLKAQVNGVCGLRVPEPLLIYRMDTGQRRMKIINPDGSANDLGKTVLSVLGKRYNEFYDGGKQMSPCVSCGGSDAANAILKAKGTINRQMDDRTPVNETPVQQNTPSVVRLEYIGERFGATTYNANGRSYRAGANPYDKYIDCPPEDAEVLEAQGVFKRVQQPVSAVQAAPPPPVQTVPAVVPELTEAQKSQQAQSSLMKARKEFDEIWKDEENKPVVPVKVVASRADIPAPEPPKVEKPTPKSGRKPASKG